MNTKKLPRAPWVLIGTNGTNLYAWSLAVGLLTPCASRSLSSVNKVTITPTIEHIHACRHASSHTYAGTHTHIQAPTHTFTHAHTHRHSSTHAYSQPCYRTTGTAKSDVVIVVTDRPIVPPAPNPRRLDHTE